MRLRITLISAFFLLSSGLSFSQEAQEALVVVRPHVEQIDKLLVVSVGELQALPNHLAHLSAREIAGQKRCVNDVPKDSTFPHHAMEKVV